MRETQLRLDGGLNRAVRVARSPIASPGVGPDATAEADVSLEWLPSTAPAPSAGRAELIGRERELAGLRAALNGAVQSCGRLIWIAGEPGIGKTRLAEQLVADARACGADTVWGRCWSEEGAPELWPWVQVIRTCLRRVDEEALRKLVGPHASELTALVAAPDSAPSVPSPAAARFRLFNAIAHFLDAYARRTPLVIVLEDLHRADPQSLLLLQFFAQEQRERPILLVATYREPSVPANPALVRSILETMREPGCERIELGGLSVSETRAFLGTAVGREPPVDFAAGLHGRTGGSPLFLAECARQLTSGRDAGVEWRWPGPEELFITAELGELIDQRLAMLTREEDAILRSAAAMGREFRAAALGEPSTNGAAGDRASALRAAERVGILRPGSEVGWHSFAQSMVRERLLEGVARDRDDGARAPAEAPASRSALNGSATSAANADAAAFRKEGEFWTITFANRTCRMRDGKGLAFIGLLLRHPGRPVHVTEIVQVQNGCDSGPAPIGLFDDATEVRVGLGDGGAILDRPAKDAYRRRLRDLQSELEQAQQYNDAGRVERARYEIEFLNQELTAAIGLGGRDRRVGSDAERARVNVTRSIARAIQKIDEVHPELARHLTQTIRTGTFCTYVAEPATARTWDF